MSQSSNDKCILSFSTKSVLNNFPVQSTLILLDFISFIRFKHSWSPPSLFLYLTTTCHIHRNTPAVRYCQWPETHYYSFSRNGGWCILSILDTKWWNFLFKYSAYNKTIPFTCRIDPYEGNPRRSLTWGSTINHSLNQANVKPFIAEKNSDNPRVFLVALHDIAQTTELLWNYNDDQFHFYSNSQTLPKEH